MDNLFEGITKGVSENRHFTDGCMDILSDIKVEPVDKEFTDSVERNSLFEQVFISSFTEDMKPIVQNLHSEEVTKDLQTCIKEEFCVLEKNSTAQDEKLHFVKEEIYEVKEISNFTHNAILGEKETDEVIDNENLYEKQRKLCDNDSNIEFDLNQENTFGNQITIHQSVSRISTYSNSRDITNVAVQRSIFHTASGTKDLLMNTILTDAGKHTADADACGSVNVTSTMSIFQHSSLRKCKLCGFASTKSRLKMHMLTHRDLPQIKCSKCDKSFTKITLPEHFKLFHSDSFECAKCSSVFRTLKLLKVHMLQDVNCAKWKCVECNHISSSKRYLKIHMLKHTNPRLFTCLECKQHFSTKSYLKKHILTHIKSDLLKCSERNQNFTSKLCVEQDLLKHADQNWLTCSVCDKTFHYKSTLKEHMLTHIYPVLFKCSECDKHFSSRYLLKVHRLVHSDPDIHKCSECGKRFSTIHNLDIHMLKHTNPEKFTCKDCNMCYCNKQFLKWHMLLHKNPDQFKCSECGKCFSTPYYLKKHMKRHTNPLIFNCSECSTLFSSRKLLKMHMLLHTDKDHLKCS